MQIVAGKWPFPYRVISFFFPIEFPHCQNNSHKNGQQTFFNNITSKSMTPLYQSCRKNNLQTCIRILWSLLSSNFFWHKELKCVELIVNYIWLWYKWNPCKKLTDSIEKSVALPSVPSAPFFSFLKADSYPLIQAFQKVEESKDRGWHVTSYNFRLLVKNNFSACVVVLIEWMLNTCK